MESVENKTVINAQVGDILNAQKAMIWLGEQKLPVPLMLSYMATKRIANTKIADYQELSNSIIRRYSNGGNAIPPNSPGVIEINELLKQPVEIPDPGITWEMVKDFDWPNTNTLEALTWLIHDIPL